MQITASKGIQESEGERQAWLEDGECQMLNSGSNTNNIKVLLDLMSRITMGF
jgi:hypothetical protein